MKIKIVSDGTPKGTRVNNAETGELLTGVLAVEWAITSHGGAIAKLTLRDVEVKLIGQVEIVNQDQQETPA